MPTHQSLGLTRPKATQIQNVTITNHQCCGADSWLLTTEFTVLSLPYPGDVVRKLQRIAEIESEKSVHELDSPCDGMVVSVHVSVGQICKPGQELIAIQPLSDVVTASAVLETSNIDGSSLASLHDSVGWNIRAAVEADMDQLWEIWIKNQQLASQDADLGNQSELFRQFCNMTTGGLQPPFCVYCAVFNNAIDGWVACFPTKNNPLSRGFIAEVSLYVNDPFAKQTCATLLLAKAIDHARTAGMSFLIA